MVEAAVRRARSLWPGSLILLFLVAGVTLTRGPYLQSVTGTSAIVVWQTAAPGSSRVDYGVGDYTNSIDLPDPTTEHVITLTDLITGTEVIYRVSTDGVELASGSFRTAAAPDQPFSFAVIGDSGTGSRDQYAVADRMVALDPDLVLHTGDVVYPDGQASGYDPFFFKPYQTLARRAPIFPVLGNHDYHRSARLSLISTPSICRRTIPRRPSATTRSIGATRISRPSISTPGRMRNNWSG